MSVEVLADPDAVARRGRELLLGCITAAHHAGRQAYIALSGGYTPKTLYGMLAGDPGDVDWSGVHLFVSDDRFVDLSDDRSNSGTVERTLRQSVIVRKAHWHPLFAVEGATVDEVASRYETEIRHTLPNGSVPRFDLITLGLGSDGHTASLFPGKPALDVDDRLVVATPPGVLPPAVERVTFTFPLLNAGRMALFLSTGKEKAEAFTEVRRQLDHSSQDSDVPAARVRPADGRLIWLVDRGAAGASWRV